MHSCGGQIGTRRSKCFDLKIYSMNTKQVFFSWLVEFKIKCVYMNVHVCASVCTRKLVDEFLTFVNREIFIIQNMIQKWYLMSIFMSFEAHWVSLFKLLQLNFIKIWDVFYLYIESLIWYGITFNTIHADSYLWTKTTFCWDRR